jgi:DNA integrity scanning protein DisA with diadenylate cyclase activity
LLIYDPSNRMSDHIVNTHSKVGLVAYEEGSAQSILRGRIVNIRPGAIETAARYKRLLLELASVDGALIFSDKSIQAFGAMVETHPKATGQYGARTTAALSAFHYGAHPIKISADGDVTIFFNSEDEHSQKHQAELAFA